MLYRNYIAGEWIDSTQACVNVNPSDLDDVIGEYAEANGTQVDDAVQAAYAAFPEWARSGLVMRHDILRRVGQEIFVRRDEIADLLSREEGKTRAEALGEVGRAAQIFEFFASEVLRLAGEVIPSVRPGVSVSMTREPVGVIGIITPWNFPIAIPAWKIAPALAYGNCIVFKPAELTPACAWLLADILARAGVPKGVFNLVMGRGEEVGAQLVSHPRIQAISFTGSYETGARIRIAAAVHGPRLQMEMGGKNPLVVLADADLDLAARVALDGSFFQTGQRCTASSRLIVQEQIHDAFVEKLKALLDQQVVGDAREVGTTIGPVSCDDQIARDLSYLDIAKQEGAQLLCGGDRVSRKTRGFYMSPALFAETSNNMRINREEVFGPVASIIRARDYDDALAIANDTDFGLCAGICTSSLRHAEHFKRNADVGMVMVNLPTAGVDYHVPFGGRKKSSYGPREQGRYAVEFYTSVKTTYLNAGAI